MSRKASVSTGTPYGVERVCETWEQARSTFYEQQENAEKLAQGIRPGKRGPKPRVPDEELLDLIRGDLGSPFRRKGHRKVWGRLHFGHGLALRGGRESPGPMRGLSPPRPPA